MSAKGYQKQLQTKEGKDYYWTTDLNTELPIKFNQSDYGKDAPETIP